MSLPSAASRNRPVSWVLLGCVASACSGTFTTPEPEPIAGPDARGRGGSGTSLARSNGGTGGDSPTSLGSGGNEASDGGLSLPAERGGSGGTSAGMEEEVFCDAVSKVFMLRCGGGSCHTNPGATIGDFAVGTAEAESYVNVQSVRNPVCGLIIDPVNPSDSLILRKLIGGFPSPTCGGAMPVTGGDLTDDQIDCVASWVRKFEGSE